MHPKGALSISMMSSVGLPFVPKPMPSSRVNMASLRAAHFRFILHSI